MPEIRLQDYSTRIADLIQAGRPDAAIAHCQHILRTYPKHIQTYCHLGQACLSKGMIEVAMGFFQRTLSADPENVAARIGLATIHARDDRLPEAVWHMERAYELAPGDKLVRSELQRLYAERDGEKPNLKLTRTGLGRLYARSGLLTKAIAEFKAILQQDPDLPHVQIALGEALWREGRRVEAVETCLDLTDALPNCLKGNLILGEIWVRGGHEEAGREKLNVARALDPENLVAIQMMGQDSPLQAQTITVSLLHATPEGAESEGSAQPSPGAREDRLPNPIDVDPSQPEEVTRQGELSATLPAAHSEMAGRMGLVLPADPLAASQAVPVEMVPDWLLALARDEAGPPVESGRPAPAQELPVIPDLRPKPTGPYWRRMDQSTAGQDGESTRDGEARELHAASRPETPLPDHLAAEELPDWLLAGMPSPAATGGPVTAAQPRETIPTSTTDLESEREDLPRWLQELAGPTSEEVTEPVTEGLLGGPPLPEVPAAVGALPDAEVLEGEREDRTPPWGAVPTAAEGALAAGEAEVEEALSTPGIDTDAQPRLGGEIPDWVRAIEEIVGQKASWPDAESGGGEQGGSPPEAEAPRTQPDEDPASHKARLELARLHCAQGDWDRALDQYEGLIRSGRFVPQVISDLEDLEDQATDRVRFYLLVGDALRQEGRLEEALRTYRQARQAWTDRQA